MAYRSMNGDRSSHKAQREYPLVLRTPSERGTKLRADAHCAPQRKGQVSHSLAVKKTARTLPSDASRMETELVEGGLSGQESENAGPQAGEGSSEVRSV